MKSLLPEQAAFWEANGYLVIEDFLSAAQLADLNAEIDRLVIEQAGLAADQGGFNLEKAGDNPFGRDAEIKAAGVFRKIQSLAQVSPPLDALGRDERLLDIAEDLLGPDLYFHSNKLMFKPAHHGSAKPWHQDYAYWQGRNPEPNQLSAWLALEEATVENGCLELLPGSHRLGLLDHHQAELQIALDAADLSRSIVCPIPAGGLILFHCLTLHYSAPNRSSRSRRGMIYTYSAGAEVGEPLRVPGRAPA